MLEPMLTDVPRFFPGACIDGRQDGPVVDTFIDAGGYGRVYLSRQTVRDAGRLMGMVDREDTEAVERELRELRAHVVELEGRLAELGPVEQALLGAAARFRDTDQEHITFSG